jgi:hypothetical protein
MIVAILIGLVMLWSGVLAVSLMIWTIPDSRFVRPIDRIIAFLMIVFVMCCGVYGSMQIVHNERASQAAAERRAE